jgi:hypothetical protein
MTHRGPIWNSPEGVRCATAYPGPPEPISELGSSSQASTFPGSLEEPGGATPAILAVQRPMRNTLPAICEFPPKSLLHTSSLRWAARAGPRTRWLLLPGLRSFGATQTLHRCSSSRTGKIFTPSYDFALPWVSCESGSHKGRSFPDATASARIVALEPRTMWSPP